MGISGGLCALSHYDARTRLVSLPNTGAGPDSERGLQHTIPIQREREREELSYDFIPASGSGWPGRSQPQPFLSISSPFVVVCGLHCTVCVPVRTLCAPRTDSTQYTVLRSANSHRGRSFLALDCVFLMSGLCEELWTNERPGDGEGGHPQTKSHL